MTLPQEKHRTGMICNVDSAASLGSLVPFSHHVDGDEMMLVEIRRTGRWTIEI